MTLSPPLVPKTKNFLGNYLRNLRKKHGRSYKYVAEKLNLSMSYIYAIEDGRTVTRDKGLLKSWVRVLSDGKEPPETAYKLAMITYPEMLVRVNKLSAEDRIRLLALIQKIHLTGMPKAVSSAIDESIIKPNGTTVRMKSCNANIPEVKKLPVVQRKLVYEDFHISPELTIADAGTMETKTFLDFMNTPGHEPLGEKSTGAFND